MNDETTGVRTATDSHCHVLHGAARHFICSARQADFPAVAAASVPDVRFFGIHPWHADEFPSAAAELRHRLLSDPVAGVGETGLDRLRSRDISPAMRSAFEAQLALAAELRRPVVLHGAKCWGQVLEACRPFAERIPAFLFHGFSRAGGLVPAIDSINGFISIGPALLNDHAVNYRSLAKEIPLHMLLAETDATADSEPPPLDAIIVALAGLRGTDPVELAAALEANANRFLEALLPEVPYRAHDDGDHDARKDARDDLAPAVSQPFA